MSLRTIRKLQRGEDQGKNLSELASEVASEDHLLEEEEPTSPAVRINRFSILTGPESEVKDDELNESENDKSAKPNPAMGGARKKKRKKKRAKCAATSSEVSMKNYDPDDIEMILREVNAEVDAEEGGGEVVGSRCQKVSSRKRELPNVLQVEHKHLNPQNEMRRIFGSRVVEGSSSRSRRGRTIRSGKTTWLVAGLPQGVPQPRLGISMTMCDSTQGCQGGGQVFKYEHNHTYQKAQFRFLDAVESFNPDNIMTLLQMEPFHVDTLLQMAEIFRLADDSATAAQLVERALFVLESSAHPLFSLTTGICRLQYKQQENRCFFIALFRHILNVGHKGCHRTALELCKLLLSLSPDDDPLAVSLMIDFYALRSKEYAWLVALYDLYEPTKNLSMLPSFAFSVPLALFHLSCGDGDSHSKERKDGSSGRTAIWSVWNESSEKLRSRADEMLQSALLMFPGVLIPLLDKCNVQPDPIVASHAFFGPAAQDSQNKGLSQIVNLYIGRSFHVWKEDGVLPWLEDNVQIVLTRVDASDVCVSECEEKRKTRYLGTPTAIYRHIIMADVKDATAPLPPSLANTPVMSHDTLPPFDSVCGYSRPAKSTRQGTSQSTSGLGILTSFIRSLSPAYDPNATEPEVEENVGAVGGEVAGGVGEARDDLRMTVNTLLEAMRELLSNIHPPDVVDVDQGEDSAAETGSDGEWD